MTLEIVNNFTSLKGIEFITKKKSNKWKIVLGQPFMIEQIIASHFQP